ncbi:DNA-binding NarL/FixJ family response regulator [Microbacterium ginsengiterrae]|uniref:DNA-binding NarL/FixJ family response regulator n=1 Tax=Microbacterium ginsengiterrae TaxID=546115 RepID=A0A7W9FDL1_9MICO|nr:DNA-binding NarL/FixJ family response regulator [Microbacterium ginsengiterrae]
MAIVEDQPLFRSLVEALVRGSDDCTVVVSCGSVQEARQQLLAESPDVVIMDIGLPDGNGFGLARSMRTQLPDLGVLLLSAHDVMDLLLELPAKERTGWSYLSKNSAASAELLLGVVRITANGGSVLDPDLLRELSPRAGSPLAKLTPRQFDALRLLAAGRSNSAIAREMDITPHSVDNLLNTVYGILGVRGDTDANSRVSAALMMIRHGAPTGEMT